MSTMPCRTSRGYRAPVGLLGLMMTMALVRGVTLARKMCIRDSYKGSTPVGEQLYYAGGADGAGAIFVLIVPESNTSAIFIGPATVGEDNKLTITDETTGSSITFEMCIRDRPMHERKSASAASSNCLPISIRLMTNPPFASRS